MKKISTVLVPTVLAATVFAGMPASLVQAEISGPSQSPASSVVFDHVSVVDVKTGQLQENMTVVVKGDKIAELGKSGQVTGPKDAKVVDATGKFLIPGLWDMHTHIMSEQNVDFPMLAAHGVTGIRDMGSYFENYSSWKQAEKNGEVMPEIFSTIMMVDGATSPFAFRMLVGTEEEAREAVRLLKKRGADHVKVYEQVTPELFYAIADEAKKQGLKMVGHVPYQVPVDQAAAAGMSSIEHLAGVYFNTTPKSAEFHEKLAGMSLPEISTKGFYELAEAAQTYDSQLAAPLYKQFVEQGVYHVPTLATLNAVASMDTLADKLAKDPRTQYIPEPVVTNWSNMINGLGATDGGELLKNYKRFYGSMQKTVSDMHKAGVQLLAGTDFVLNVLPMYPGGGLHDELEEFVKVGLTPAEALRTATINPATYLGVEDRVGTVETGKEADLVLLNGNPLIDINNVRKIESVMLNGKLLEQAQIQEMMSELAVQAKQPLPIPEMIPVRELEAKGVVVEWNGATRSVTVTKGDNTVVLTIDQDIVTLNGVKFRTGSKIGLVDGRTTVSREMMNALLEI